MLPPNILMTQRFLNFIPFVLDHEGGIYENDPDDPGGATKWGIDSRSHPSVDIKNLTKDGATEIYFTSYWARNRCGELSAKLGECHMDACVNCGPVRANKFLGLSNGQPTLYNNQRDAFYHRLVVVVPRSRKYLKGWLNRTRDLKRYLDI